MAIDLVSEVKTRLSITGDFFDSLIAGYIDDVKEYLLAAGVPEAVVESEEAVGCIARGVADLWRYGDGDGELSTVFRQRVVQMALREAQE